MPPLWSRRLLSVVALPGRGNWGYGATVCHCRRYGATVCSLLVALPGRGNWGYGAAVCHCRRFGAAVCALLVALPGRGNLGMAASGTGPCGSRAVAAAGLRCGFDLHCSRAVQSGATAEMAGHSLLQVPCIYFFFSLVRLIVVFGARMGLTPLLCECISHFHTWSVTRLAPSSLRQLGGTFLRDLGHRPSARTPHGLVRVACIALGCCS